MRRLINANKKLRGVARRLRALKEWSVSFAGYFPSCDELDPDIRYLNWKIPVELNLVQGRWSTPAIQRKCAQRLIDACMHLIAAKPESAGSFRVTCVVCLPDMFASELCIYLDEDHFQSHTSASGGPHEHIKVLAARRLSEQWSLELPNGVGELGVSVERNGDEDEPPFSGEQWYFGEVLPTTG